MKRTFIATFVALACAASAVQAIGLFDAYHAARESDPTWRAALKENEAGQENRNLGRAGLLPQISASGYKYKVTGDRKQPYLGRTFTEDLDYTSKSASVQLSQPLFNMQRLAEYRQGNARAEYSDAVLDQKLQDLAVRLSGAYMDVLLARDSIDLAEAKLKAISEQLAAAKRMYELGDGTVTDVDEATARRDIADAQRIEAEDRLQVSLKTLQELIGETPRSLAVLSGDAFVLPTMQDSAAMWTERALANNPEIRAQRKAVEISDREIDRSKAGHYPTVDLVGSFSKADSDSVTTVNQRTTSRSIGVQVNIPLFSGGYTSALTRQAAANRDKAKEDLEAAISKIRTEVVRQYTGTTTGASKVRALDLAVKSSERSLKSTLMGFKAGLRTNADILNAQEQLYQSRRDLAEAKYIYLISRVRLKAAAGELSEADIIEVDRYFSAEAAF